VQFELTSDKSVPDQQRFQKTWQSMENKMELRLRWRAARDNRRSDAPLFGTEAIRFAALLPVPLNSRVKLTAGQRQKNVLSSKLKIW
jgi:cellulose synthase/poly-beta-1,6-N-acetylglucosamine synthase-like glycosyltransferase